VNGRCPRCGPGWPGPATSSTCWRAASSVIPSDSSAWAATPPSRMRASRNVLGADFVVVAHPGLFLGQNYDATRPVGESLEHASSAAFLALGPSPRLTETRYISFAEPASLNVLRSCPDVGRVVQVRHLARLAAKTSDTGSDLRVAMWVAVQCHAAPFTEDRPDTPVQPGPIWTATPRAANAVGRPCRICARTTGNSRSSGHPRETGSPPDLGKCRQLCWG
jgi:hypothetical protein